jgi:hypothetical protein
VPGSHSACLVVEFLNIVLVWIILFWCEHSFHFFLIVLVNYDIRTKYFCDLKSMNNKVKFNYYIICCILELSKI